MYPRKQIFIDSNKESLFLWGARQTGKSSLIKVEFKNALVFDLLLSDVYERLLKNNGLIRQMLEVNPVKVVVIDEIQRIPELLHEVHWIITNTKTRVILSGSSPRKILRNDVNLLGGRALRYELFPLTSAEIHNFDLIRALNNGLLPRHYDSANPKKMIAAYIGNYLRDEIITEAKIRNIKAFASFLESAAFSNAEILNYTNIASDCGVSAPTVKEYFQILNDTLIGSFVNVYQKKPKRRVIQASKFYFFDIGIVNYLLKRSRINEGTELFGNALEQFIYMEIRAHSSYSGLEYKVSYWRTASQLEVDFILGDDIALEIKSTNKATMRHANGLKQISEEYEFKHYILLSTDHVERKEGIVWFMPWNIFLEKLWKNKLMN